MSEDTEPQFATYKRTTIYSSGERTEDTITVAVPPMEWAPLTIEHSPDGTTWTALPTTLPIITLPGTTVITELVDDTIEVTDT
jgi:hypothetical protein